MISPCKKYWYTWVYVIDLDFSNFSEKHKEKFKQKNKHYKKGSRCVYVGQTSKHPTKRIKEHRQDGKSEKLGSKGSIWVKKYGNDRFSKNIPIKGFQHGYKRSQRKIPESLSKMIKLEGLDATWKHPSKGKELRRFANKRKRQSEWWERKNSKDLQEEGWGVWSN